jgi:hypothetical protein
MAKEHKSIKAEKKKAAMSPKEKKAAKKTLCAKPLLFYNNYDMYRILLLLALSAPVFTVVTGLQEQYLP